MRRGACVVHIFVEDVLFNSDGFHHLQFSARSERTHKEQLLKFYCLPYGIQLVRQASTVQEYRKILQPIGKPSKQDGLTKMKEVEYWGFVGLIKKSNSEDLIKIRAVVRRVGTGNLVFWSVMRYGKVRDNQQKLFGDGIEND